MSRTETLDTDRLIINNIDLDIFFKLESFVKLSIYCGSSFMKHKMNPCDANYCNK